MGGIGLCGISKDWPKEDQYGFSLVTKHFCALVQGSNFPF